MIPRMTSAEHERVRIAERATALAKVAMDAAALARREGDLDAAAFQQGRVDAFAELANALLDERTEAA